jgi:Ca2+-binding EF-hand superfamily protein
VTVADLVQVARHMGNGKGHGKKQADLRYDLNDDGRVDVQDLIIVMTALGTEC